jgi:ring-1,2-phenylacetyl-CoA epoxidase subunit PaaA
MMTLCNGTAAQKAMAQDALNRFWWPSLMMFGPSDKDSMHTADTTKWKIKRFSNDDLRQKFIDATVPQGHYLGLTFPDPELKFNETTGHWDIGPIDWSEFKRVVAGEGPCNRQRLNHKRATHADGAWVREAALAHAAKRRERAAAAKVAAE